MDESSSSNMSNSIISKETEVSSSFESQKQTTKDLNSTIITSIILNLKELIEENEQKNNNKKNYRDIFYLPKIPIISLDDYVRRLFIMTKMEISSLIISIMYIDRFCDKFDYVLNLYNIYKLILVTCLISIKYNEDIFIGTKQYSEIAGVSVRDLNILEYQMFVLLDYNLFIENEYYQQYYDYFLKYKKNKDKKD